MDRKEIDLVIPSPNLKSFTRKSW